MRRVRATEINNDDQRTVSVSLLELLRGDTYRGIRIPREMNRAIITKTLSLPLSRKQASANEVIAKVCLGEGTAKINYGEMARRSRFNVRLLPYFQPYPRARVRDPPFHHRNSREMRRKVARRRRRIVEQLDKQISRATDCCNVHG